MNEINSPAEYMHRALELAEKGRYTVSPNPMVGCVIVKDDQIVGEGYHDKAGNPHAEIHALNAAGSAAAGSTVYLTLEPCCHTGRTPPCTQALIAAKVKKVVIAYLDPNPLVSGKGVKALREANIDVEVGLQAERARQLNEVFNHYITHRQPFVILKWAMSLDGKTVTHEADSRQISSIETQQHAHQLRREVDAILVGANTAIRDDPLLTARLDQPASIDKQPLRIVLTSKTQLPDHLQLLNNTLPGKTLVVVIHRAYQEHYKKLGVEALILPENNGQVDLHALLEALGERQVTSLLIEGGMTVQHSFFKADLVNKMHVYLANTIIGTFDKKRSVFNLTADNLGSDYHCTAYFKR